MRELSDDPCPCDECTWQPGRTRREWPTLLLIVAILLALALLAELAA